MSRDVEKKRKRDRDRYHANAEEKRAYQRQYYMTHKAEITQRRRERGWQKVAIRLD